ncbi:MAG: AI-2E family transporter [Desulfobacterales bacterium]|jgi:predicted PurR-regulated permease PerM|nr:AI-2E family transporter [Desulfobacterales bacterium]
MSQENFNKACVLLLLLFITSVFTAMILPFLMTILMAAIFSGLAWPLYRRLRQGFGRRRSPAALVTLLVIFFAVVLPLAALLGAVTGEAIKVSQTVKPWIQRQIAEPAAFSDWMEAIPFYDRILPYKETILQKAGELVGRLSSYLINSLSSVTVMTAQFIFLLFIFFYTMFFFLVDGERILNKILYYLPLKPGDQQRMLEKFTSVTRATIKGVAVIGILQGTLTGGAFAVLGIPSAVFWGTVAGVTSLIPGIGAGIVWLPASIILIMSASYGKGVGLLLFGVVVISSIDTFLRPRLVGKDTRIHELLILFGTLGGILMFGPAGIIIGPILAALLVTVWEIYGVAFQDVLTERAPPAAGDPPPGKAARILLAEDDTKSPRA